MIYLAINILSSTFMACIFKIADRMKADKNRVILINYITASLSSFFWIFSMGGNAEPAAFHTNFYLFAAATGVFFCVSLYAQKISNTHNGVNRTAFFNKLGFMPCLFITWFVWKESPTINQVLAILVILISLYIMLWSGHSSPSSNALALFAVIFTAGFVDFTGKAFTRYYPTSQNFYFTAAYYGFAIIPAFIFLVISEKKNSFAFRRQDIVIGILAGVFNLVTNAAKLKSLSLFSTSIVLPFLAAGTLSLTTLVGWKLFGEKITSKTIIAIILATISLIIINL